MGYAISKQGGTAQLPDSRAAQTSGFSENSSVGVSVSDSASQTKIRGVVGGNGSLTDSVHSAAASVGVAQPA